MSQATRLSGTVRGQGVPVVLLHAFPLSGKMWDGAAERLARVARVFVPDLPGFGQSGRLASPSIAGMAQAVLEWSASQGVREPAIVVGLSMGGYVAFEWLRQAPERIRGFGLCSTRAQADTPEQRAGRLALIERLRRDGVAPASFLPKLLGKTTLASRPEVVEQVTALIAPASVDGIADALLAMAHRRDSTDLLPSIACPALVAAGDEDPLIPAQESASMAARIRSARLATIPHAGHLINLERPDEFHRIMEEFVRWLIAA